MSEAYGKAGVHIDTGNLFVERIRPLIQKTRRRGVLGDLGGYGGFFQPSLAEMKEPILVSSTDGVGTKLRLALDLQIFDTIGIDLVAMCVNDVVCSGAEPLFFLDYLATGKLDIDIHVEIIRGIAAACEKTKCALIGGETAEMPGCYHGVDFDLAGFAVGIVDREKIIDGTGVRVGHSVIGIASSGLHSNGFSLARKLLEDGGLSRAEDGKALLTPTKLYSPLILSLLKEFPLAAIAHITGGGFWDNIPRVLPESVQATIDKSSWSWPTLFRKIQEAAEMSDNEMLRVFNCGIGMIIVADTEVADKLMLRIRALGEEAFLLGNIEHRKHADQPVVIS